MRKKKKIDTKEGISVSGSKRRKKKKTEVEVEEQKVLNVVTKNKKKTKGSRRQRNANDDDYESSPVVVQTIKSNTQANDSLAVTLDVDPTLLDKLVYPMSRKDFLTNVFRQHALLSHLPYRILDILLK